MFVFVYITLRSSHVVATESYNSRCHTPGTQHTANPQIVFLDLHNSHKSLEAIMVAVNTASTWLLYRTHKMQPLDCTYCTPRHWGQVITQRPTAGWYPIPAIVSHSSKWQSCLERLLPGVRHRTRLCWASACAGCGLWLWAYDPHVFADMDIMAAEAT